MKIVSSLPESAVLSELGARAQQQRVGMNLTQGELAKDAGVSQRTVERLEGGSSVQLDKLLRVLRALRLSDNLDQLIPETSVRPIQLAGSSRETRRRSYKRRTVSNEPQTWVWGDEK